MGTCKGHGIGGRESRGTGTGKGHGIGAAESHDIGS